MRTGGNRLNRYSATRHMPRPAARADSSGSRRSAVSAFAQPSRTSVALNAWPPAVQRATGKPLASWPDTAHSTALPRTREARTLAAYEPQSTVVCSPPRQTEPRAGAAIPAKRTT